MLKLLNGQSVDEKLVRFNPSTYHFIWQAPTGVIDITDSISRVDKQRMVSNFDIARDNDRLYRERATSQSGRDPGGPLDTSVMRLFVKNVGESVPKVGMNIGLLLAVGIGVWFFLSTRK